jgi:mono/diheme cytochrome c family protein
MKGLMTLVLVGFFAAASSLGAEEVDPKVLGAGRAAYLSYCASCHGNAATGDGAVAESLKTKPPDLTRLTDAKGEFEEARVWTSIDGSHAASAHGTREMPVWGKALAKQGRRRGEGWAQVEIWTLIEYLKSIQQARGEDPQGP